MYKLFLAFRYLQSHRIIYFSIAGVAIGIMVLVIVTSVMNGFSRQLKERIRGMHAHILIRGIDEASNMDRYEELVQKIRQIPHVRGAAPRIEWASIPTIRGMMQFQKPLIVVGIMPEYEKDTSLLPDYFKRGGKNNFNFNYEDGSSPKLAGIVLGCELWPYLYCPKCKKKFHEKWDAPKIKQMRCPKCNTTLTGSPPYPEETHVRLTSGRSISGQSIFHQEFEVVGKFRSGMVEYDTQWLFVSLQDAQKFFKLPKAVNTVAVMLDDYKYHQQVIPQIKNILHQMYEDADKLYSIRTWEQEKAILLQAVAVEKTLQVIILFCIIIVAGFNIIAIYTLMVKAKTRDIGILMSLGATRAGVCAIFLISGVICGLIGSILGICMGLFISSNLNWLADRLEEIAKIEIFPKTIYYLESIPVAIPYDTISIIVLATIMVSLIFSIYPALRAARCNPIEAIRYE